MRTQPDLALGVCALLMVNAVAFYYSLDAVSRYLALAVHLIRLAKRIGSDYRWRWRIELANVGYARFASQAFLLGVALPSVSLTVALAWFVYPATSGSIIVAVCWWSALLFFVASIAVVILYVRRLETMLSEHVNRPVA